MAEIKGLIDDNGVIYECNKVLPEEYKTRLVEILAELEDNKCHKCQSFPKSKLHKVIGADKVYRAYIDKISGWRLRIQYGEDKRIHLCEVLKPSEYDRGTKKKTLKNKKEKYL